MSRATKTIKAIANPKAAKTPARLTDAQLRRMQAECLHTATRTLKTGREVTYTTFIPWGSDTRYKKCRLCGLVETRGVSPRATTPAKPKPPAVQQSALFGELEEVGSSYAATPVPTRRKRATHHTA